MNNPLPKYAVWNNKGGVGKTFVTFVIAAEYASVHKDKTVVVIDMCPQANVSEILLGGNGTGAENLSSLLKASPRQTIGGYFDQRITSPHAKTGTELSFLTAAHTFNKNLPENLFLVAGDPSLELQAQAINQIAAQTLPANAWANVHSWVLDLISAITTQHPEAVFFIDCNPSFAAYTEIALLASTRLVIPCTADGSSARAIDNVGQLLFGLGVPKAYTGVNFASRAKTAGMSLPSIHVVPLNRSTQYDKKASKAFGAMYTEIKDRVGELRKQIPANFSLPGATDAFLDIPDAHAVSVVSSHHGLPLGKIKIKKYNIHGIDTQVNADPLNRYKSAVSSLVSLL
ncbi:ParA family protein [Rhodoplanes sp. TEM]|uniref:ParA family protein n=1 Tax=Rhodoplanes tepidamans TaxID=200616 RepID=A0ABT5JE54_RHOTP|nr:MULTISPECIES: ParA family protein [Rhodoplanes]MDC7787564.1 ParA family protein [Rhodoplanes tepidamans]MDC7984943.1 ParA family protein [Rhodoplanes sp. TEM]MDQ0357993.1 cellulose biosynthesis protein BcsQ [Rhodoplanes tepidamans]